MGQSQSLPATSTLCRRACMCMCMCLRVGDASVPVTVARSGTVSPSFGAQGKVLGARRQLSGRPAAHQIKAKKPFGVSLGTH